MSNKTSSLKNGEIKNIIINTADNFYVVKANGHLSGEIIFKCKISGNEDFISAIREEDFDVDTVTKRFVDLSKTRRNGRRGSFGNNVSSQRKRDKTATNDRLDNRQPEGEQLGSDRSVNDYDQVKKSYSYGDESVDFWGVRDSMDETDAETSELLRGYMETAGEILSKTRGVELKEGEVRRIANSILRKYTGHYSTEHAQRIELILDVAQKNPVYPIEDVVGEVAAVAKDALSSSVFLQDVYADERADVFKAMRGFKKTYLTRDQLETLESRGLSQNMITDRKLLLQICCNRSR